MTLFLDSFDEGAYIKDQRDHLIENIWSLIGEHSKIIVTCRTNYITSTQDLMWFSKNKHEMRVMYLAPFNYQNKKIDLIGTKYFLEKRIGLNSNNLNIYLDFVQKPEIVLLLDSGFMVNIILTYLPRLLEAYEN